MLRFNSALSTRLLVALRKFTDKILTNGMSLKFCMKLDECAFIIFEKVQRPNGEHFILRAKLLGWHKAFLEGRAKTRITWESLQPQN